MNDGPWLSVIIPACDGEAYLPSALDSIEMQGPQSLECIVVDDGSVDTTLSILQAYQQRFTLVIEKRQRTGNWVRTTNVGLSRARGDYVCFLHQDDVWLGGRLSALRELTQRYPDAVLLLSPAYFINSHGSRLGVWRCPLRPIPHILGSGELLEPLIVQNFVAVPSPIFKREAALKVGGLDESLWYTADWDFWMGVGACGPSVYYDEPLAGFRIHAGSQTVMRSASPEDFRSQQATVMQAHLARLNLPGNKRDQLRRIADFSIDVNVSLAGSFHGRRIPALHLLRSLLRLGPVGAYRYFRDSRIWERVFARARARLVK